MKTILQNILNKLSEVTELKYIDEDWGQLDYYSPNMPVKFPCCLIDIQSGQFTNMGQDLAKKPRQRQNGVFSLKLSLADLKLSNTSLLAPKNQKENAWKIYDIVERIHQKLHGFSPLENCSKLLRLSFNRVMRDDGVQEYAIIYEFEAYNL